MSEQKQDTAQSTSASQERQRWRQAEMEEAERRSIVRNSFVLGSPR